MKTAALLLFLVSQAYAAPQFITFKEGKLGVNFGGYHAGVGLGGLLGGGAGGGLFAEAGTPHGQAARAGLGGIVADRGVAAGGLYAGATAGGNVRAETGLGGVTGEKSAGAGFAAAQAGDRVAASGLGGAAFQGSSSFSLSGGHNIGATKGIYKEVEVVKPVEVKPTEVIKDDKDNELDFLPLGGKAEADFNVQSSAQPAVIIKEVYVQPEQPIAKASKHHHRKTAFLGGYIEGGTEFIPPSQSPAVYKFAEPAIEKRIDVDVASSANAGAAVEAGAASQAAGAGGVTYTKQVAFQHNPTFFADIFNIPISTLKAVGNFLGNAATNTNVSVQKSASVHAGAGASAYTF